MNHSSLLTFKLFPDGHLELRWKDYLIIASQPLGATERDTHDAGHVSILRRLHDQLDAAVASAYGWPHDLAAAEIVARVVALGQAQRDADGQYRL